MFVLHELDKILHQFAENSKGRGSKDQFKITLPDVARVDVARMNLGSKMRMQPLNIDKELVDLQKRRTVVESLNDSSNDLSTDMLFSAAMRRILLGNLKALPQRAYPSARVMICDQESWELLKKFQFLTHKPADHESKFLLHREPYNVLAVLQLTDIVDQLSRLDRPFVRMDQKDEASGRQLAQFEYSVARQFFPYLKISDLIVVLHQIGNLKLRMFTSDGRQDHQIIQFLSHFARSTMLLELRSIDKAIGQHHLMFDNVTTFLPHNNELFFDSMKTLEKQAAALDNIEQKFNYHLMPPLTHLTLIAYRLIRLVQQLGWSLDSITFRRGDPNGFTKVFARILDSVLKYDSKSADRLKGTVDHIRVPARVLVLDRYFDFQGLLKHSERYGSFVEQELKSAAATSHVVAARQINALDHLDKLLCFDRLEDVLSRLLKLSVEQPTQNATPAICDNRAIQKHLVIVRQMYKMLNEGYLLLRKLESSVEVLVTQLRTLAKPLEPRQQADLVERIRRIYLAYKQLLGLKSGAIKVSDALRFACLLIDLINMLLFLQPNEKPRAQLLEFKNSIVRGEELMKELKELIDVRGNDLSGSMDQLLMKTPDGEQTGKKDPCMDLSERLDEFDQVSATNCAYRSLLSLEEIVGRFYKRQLDVSNYPVQTLTSPPTSSGLVRSGSRNKIIVLLLGSMSYDELHRLKLLETKLMPKASIATNVGKKSPGNRQACEDPQKDMLTIACGFIRPDEFIYSL